MGEVEYSSFSKVCKPYGRIYYDVTLFEYASFDTTSLFLAEITQEFIPGKVCDTNNEIGYNRDYLVYDGYTHVKTSQNVADLGNDEWIYGSTSILKDAFPVIQPSTVTITSSYEEGQTFGFSVGVLFSLTEGIGADGEAYYDYSNSGTYTKSYTDTEPALSTQHGTDANEFQWTYLYETLQAKNNYMKLGYMFEANRYNNDGRDIYRKFDMTIEKNVKFVTTDHLNIGYNIIDEQEESIFKAISF